MGAAYQVIDERYPEGKEVDIYYCPDAPKKAFVERFAKMPVLTAIYMFFTMSVQCP